MYRTLDSQLSVYDFLPPYHGELSPDNRWVRLAAAIDWKALSGNTAPCLPAAARSPSRRGWPWAA